MTTKQGSTNEQDERDHRPASLRYEEHRRMIEQMIMDVLPEVIQKLGSMAKEGNLAAAKYLIDRIHGRPAQLTTPAVADTTLRYDNADWTADRVKQRANRDERARIALLSISHTAARRKADEVAHDPVNGYRTLY